MYCWVIHLYTSPDSQSFIFTPNWCSSFGFYQVASNLVYLNLIQSFLSEAHFSILAIIIPLVIRALSFLDLTFSNIYYIQVTKTTFFTSYFSDHLSFPHSTVTVIDKAISVSQPLTSLWHTFFIVTLCF
jgi:hypothetical protein